MDFTIRKHTDEQYFKVWHSVAVHSYLYMYKRDACIRQEQRRQHRQHQHRHRIGRPHREKIAVGGYAVAGAVAFLRLYNDRHWLNDVIAGAGIGILSARIGYWMLPLYRKWFHWDKKRATVVMMPQYDPCSHVVGLGLAASF